MRRTYRRNRLALVALTALAVAGGLTAWHYMGKGEQPVPDDVSSPRGVAAARESDPATRPITASIDTSPTSPEPTSRAAAATLPAASEPLVPTRATASTAPAVPFPPTHPAVHFNPATLLGDAQALVDRNNMLDARRMLNQAIISGTLSASQETAAKKLQEELNQTLVFSPRRLPNDEWIDSYTVQPGDMLKVIAPKYNLSIELIQHINRITIPTKMRRGITLKLPKGPFHAIVTKSAFTIDMYLGAPGGPDSLFICTFPVGLGQDDSTPVGRWQVTPNSKVIHPVYYDPRNQGVTYEPSDPRNPLGEYWIGLSGLDGQAAGKLSYGIHGTIEPNSVGKMSSMGCIRLRNEDVKLVYEMLVDSKSSVIVKP